MKIAICDDIQEEKLLLKNRVETYMKENDYEAEIVDFNSGEDLMKSFKPGAYDIIFLDIFMGGMNGMETAKAIRAIDEACFIIFASSSEAYAIDSFDVSAIYYLLKPIAYEKLETAFSKCMRYFKDKQKKLVIESERKELVFYYQSICYIEVYNHKATIVTTEGETSLYIPISKLSDQLNELPFIRCHRSYIVNLRQVEAVQNDEFRLKDGEFVPIGRSYRKLVKAVYKDYLVSAVRKACPIANIS